MLTAPSQVVTEDITYIESQNKGLQVQTTNQQALLAELERLLVSPRHRVSVQAKHELMRLFGASANRSSPGGGFANFNAGIART
jgi:hypothetical protein